MGCAIQGQGQLQKLCQIERGDQNSVYTVSYGRSVDRQASRPTPLQRIGIWDCASRNGHRTHDRNDARLEYSARPQPHDSWCVADWCGCGMALPTALQFHITQAQSESCPPQAAVASGTASDHQNRFTDWCVFWNAQPLDSGQLMHHDIHPLAPFSAANPLTELVSHDGVYQLCAVLGLIGSVAWAIGNWQMAVENDPALSASHARCLDIAVHGCRHYSPMQT